jgi:hypothetical protein
MHLRKHTVWGIIFILFLLPKLYALTWQAETFFQIKGIRFKEDRVVLPLSRNKYNDIRVLDQQTFSQLKNCQTVEICSQNLTKIDVKIENVRSIKEFFLVDVNLGDRWLVTFVVLKNGKDFMIKPPTRFKFLSNVFKEEVERAIRQGIQ